MNGTEATADVFFTAFKALNRREREAVLKRILANKQLAEDVADTLALEARRHQPRQPFRSAMRELSIRA